MHGRPEDYVSFALRLGEGLLRCGAEVRRVEDSVRRICLAYGAREVHVFCLLTLISVTVIDHDGNIYTQTLRASGEEIHLAHLEEYNRLSRALCSSPTTLAEAETQLKEIHTHSPFSSIWDYPAAFFAAGAFAVYFGGTFRDAFSAGLIGVFLTALDAHRRFPLNPAVRVTLFSFLSSFLSFLLSHFIPVQPSLTFIGSVILLIPGLSVGNSIRDLLEGDFLSGILRLTQAVISASGIALGYAAANLLWR